MSNTQPLQVVTTADKRERIAAIADAEGISQAQVVRDLVDAGLDKREKICERRTGRVVSST